MKKFWAVCFSVFLIFSAEARAACYVGMPFVGEVKKWAPNYNCRGCGSTEIFICTSCSGGTCVAAVGPGTMAQQGCKRSSTSKTYNIYRCKQCIDGAEWRYGDGDGYNGCDCKKGYYNLGNYPLYSCLKCNSITGGICTSCIADRDYNYPVCTEWTCSSGYYRNANPWNEKCVSSAFCKPCSSISVSNGTCTGCTADGSACTSATCSAGYVWNGSGCARRNCSAGQYVKGNSCAACPSGTWSNGGTATSCQSCSSISVSNGTCTACTTTGSCSEFVCSDGYALKNGFCVVKKCVSGTYEDASGNCRSCSDIAVAGGECTSCSYDGSVCESVRCADGWTNASVTSCTPTKNCSAGGFWDEESQSCKRCDTYMIANGGCVECDAKACSKAECDKPNMTFNSSAQKCGVECAANQYLDASLECQTCEKGQYAAGGWSAEATSCTSCSTIAVEGGTCVECSNAECLKASCGDGWRLDESGKKCLKNAANCLDGLSVTADGCCCAK